MLIRITAASLVALAACAKKEEAPAAPAPELFETAPAPVEATPAFDEDALAGDPEDVVADDCPVLDSRNWKASTAADEGGHVLTIEGEVDLPTPGYAVTWRAGIADRAFPPGLRVHLDAAAPSDLVMQVVTPTPVSFSMKGANANYRVIYVLCGGEAIAEIDDVGPQE